MLLISSTIFFCCTKSDTNSVETLNKDDLITLQKRKNQRMRTMNVMALELPLYASLPILGDSQVDFFLKQGDKVRVLDETLYGNENSHRYFYVETMDGCCRGYVPQVYLVGDDYSIGITMEYTTHYFQPDINLGSSSSIFLPAYTAIFSNNIDSNSLFVFYKGVDVQGYPVEGYLQRSTVSFTENIWQAYLLYRKAFTSGSIQEQVGIAKKLSNNFVNTPFARLAEELVNVRNLSSLESRLVIFDRNYMARRNEAVSGVVPIYSAPRETSYVLGYMRDDQILEVSAGYEVNDSFIDVLSPYNWYLVDLRGWILAKHIIVEEYLEEINLTFIPMGKLNILESEGENWE